MSGAPRRHRLRLAPLRRRAAARARRRRDPGRAGPRRATRTPTCVAHAVIDALLGAAGARRHRRPLPRRRPALRGRRQHRAAARRVAGDARRAGLAGRERRRDRARRATAAGAVQAARWRSGWRARWASTPARVNVKATTNEGMGFVGRGEGIAALAVAHDRADGLMATSRSGSTTRSRGERARARAARARASVGIYACGPTVYGRIHVGNARPYVMFALFKRFLEHEGYDVTLVENVTDINDKIYVAAREQGVPSEAAGARDDGRLPRRHRPARRWAGPTASRSRARRSAEIIDADRGADRARARLRVRRRRLLQRAQLRRATASSRTGGSRTSRRRTRASRTTSRRCKRDPLDFALWKAHKPDEDTAWDSPWGRGRPGLAHRVLGDGGEDPRARLRHPRRRVGPRVPAPRERDRADRGGPRPAAGPHLDAQRHDPLRRGEDGEVGREHHDCSPTRSTSYGRDALIMYFLGGPLPPAAGVLGRALEQAARRSRRADRELRPAAGALGRRSPAVTRRPDGGRRCATSSSRRCATTSTRRRRWPRCSSWSARATGGSRRASRCRARRPPSREMLEVLGPREPARGPDDAGRRGGAAPRSASASRRAATGTSRAPTRSRDELLARGLRGARHARGPGAGPAPE